MAHNENLYFTIKNMVA